MDLQFDIGDAAAPAGHALVYFTVAGGSEVVATYVFVPPISFNLEKYVPPMFASMMPATEMNMEMAAPIPPIAEAVPGVDWLRNMAMARHDDLVHAGNLFSGDVANVAAMTQEAAAEYARLYKQGIGERVAEGAGASAAPSSETSAGPDYAGWSDEELLNEVTRLVGRLRDALRTEEEQNVRAELERAALALPAKYRAWEVAAAASQPGEKGQRLASLYLTRNYRLLNEEYLEVAEIERQIAELEASESSA